MSVTPGPRAFQTLGRFDSGNHFGSIMLRGKIVPRLTASLGYTISNSDGSQIYTNPRQVPGALKNTFHKPAAELDYDLTRGLTANFLRITAHIPVKPVAINPSVPGSGVVMNSPPAYSKEAGKLPFAGLR